MALGEVAIVHKEGNDATLVAHLGPGEVVGEVALILRRPAITDVGGVPETRGGSRGGGIKARDDNRSRRSAGSDNGVTQRRRNTGEKTRYR